MPIEPFEFPTVPDRADRLTFPARMAAFFAKLATFPAWAQTVADQCLANATTLLTTEEIRADILSRARSGGHLPPGIWLFWGGQECPDWALEQGSIVSVSAYPELVAATYCGNSNNASARGFYRTTSTSNPSANRSPYGQYFVIPDENYNVLAAADDLTFFAGEHYGSWEITQTLDQMPSHRHLWGGNTRTTGLGGETAQSGGSGGIGTSYEGGGDPMEIVQPTSFYKLIITY